MWSFAKRYVSWYFWLGIYATAIGALFGFLLASISPFLPFMVLWFLMLYSLALACAATLNLVFLPIVFHAVRTHAKRLTILSAAGFVGGFVSPLPGMWAWCLLKPAVWPSLFMCRATEPLYDRFVSVYLLLVFGAIAGLVCARLFDKHGDKGSIFDLNAALESLNRDRQTDKTPPSAGIQQS